MIEKTATQINDDLLRPLLRTSGRFWIAITVLGLVVAAAIAAFGYQAWNGIGVWGIDRPVFWAFDITNFVFWIGISHAGTLISAILRIANATWRRPITRCAEVITLFALMIGGMFPIIHLGKPWLFFWMIPYPSERQIWPQFRSPLAWDFFAIGTYLTGSFIFLVYPIIPDWALVRDNTTGWRHKLYRVLALGWRGTPKQWHRLESAMHIMAIVIIPVAVSVHTIVSWDFAMAPVPMWHSTIFGPYFVAGAIFSGIAGLIIAMAFLRKLLHLEEYLLPIHFDNLGKLLLMMCLLWLYFVFAERLTVWYGNEPAEMAVFWATQRGPFAPLFWTMVFCNFLIPFPLLAIKKFRTTIPGVVIASCTVVVGMWLERFLIIVPSLSHKYLPYAYGSYRPTWVEITIMAGTFAAMALLYILFSKFVPIIAIWEFKAGLQKTSVVRSQLPVERIVPLSCRVVEPLKDWGASRLIRYNTVFASSMAQWPNDSMTQFLYALYPDPDSAQRAVHALRAAAPDLGFGSRDIAVLSSEPFDGYEFFHQDHKTLMPWIAVLGGLAGGLTGFWFAAFTQKAYPLPTGGMPIVALWPNGIISYEMTMLGAVLFTLLTLLFTARLPNWKRQLYDPEISDGKILVGVAMGAPDASLEGK